MSSPKATALLTVLIGPSKSQYLHLPAEKNARGKFVRQVIILRKLNFEIKQDDVIEPSEYETTKCYIRNDVRAKDLLEKVENLRDCLSKDEDPKRKVNRVTTAWALEGWLYDNKGNRLSASPPAPSEQSRANTDASKNTREKKSLFGNTLPPMTREQIAKQEASVKVKDSTAVSSHVPTSSKSRDGKKVGSFLVSDSESDQDSLFVSQKTTYPKSAADSKPKNGGVAKERTAQGKQPIRNEASHKARDSTRVSSNLPTSSRPKKDKRVGPFLVSDSESDQDSSFVSQKPTYPKSAAGGKTIEPPKPAKKKTTTNTDLAGDDSNRRERVRATDELSRGTARRRSKSPDRPTKNTEAQRQGGDSSHNSSRPPAEGAVRKGVAVKKEIKSTSKNRSSKKPTGNELASTAGLYYKSKGKYTVGRQTWSTEEIDTDEDTETHWEKEAAKLEKARRAWKKEHGTEL
ncbi:hypothetical protein BTUL_0118g00050 [Botrytis tulipae]|uniref:Uncharacterized protein n=1 Tax=Botrytis tulipae TaxID=87230 RepID=A0A4Z1EKD2_9HELO|nr:hypothetical protein BTUL_0118g00050 [Botrytis tulipae]